MANKMNLRLGLQLIPPGMVKYPVMMHIWASAVRKVRGRKKDVELRRRFYYRVIKVGDIDVRKLRDMSDQDFDISAHPDYPFSLVGEHISMKLPNVIPQDYAMCEVGIQIVRIGRRDHEAEEAADLLGIIGPMVQSHLDTIAQLCGGLPQFSKEEQAAAQVKADGGE